MRTFTYIVASMIMLGLVGCPAEQVDNDTAEENSFAVSDSVADIMQMSRDAGLTVKELCVYNNQLIWLTWDEKHILIYKDEEQVSAPTRSDNFAYWSYEFQVTEQGIFQINEIYGSVIFADPFGKTLSVNSREGSREQWRILWDGEALDGHSVNRSAFFCQEMVIQRLLSLEGNVAGFSYACDSEFMTALPGPEMEINNNPNKPPWAFRYPAAKP